MRSGALILVIAALVLGALFGSLMVKDAGYVLISYDNATFETSVWFALFGLLIVLGIGYTLFAIVRRLIHGRSNVSTWFQRRRVRGARKQTVQGLLQMAEGRWAEAKKALEGSVDGSETPLINYLNAARAAHELDDVDERDRLLRLAHETTPGSRFAVGLTQAELQRNKGQWEQCLATLIRLRSDSPRHPQVLAMLLECYKQLEDWESILGLVPDLKKNKVKDPAELDAMLTDVWSRRLAASRGSADAARHAENTWKAVPKDLKKHPGVVLQYVKLLDAAGNANQAEAVLRTSIGADFRDDWVELYGRINSDQVSEQLIVAERWLKERPNNPVLLLALGRLSLMNEQWGKAREYFEASLRLSRTREVYGELGRLCLALGDIERGGEFVAQSLTDLPELPLPKGSGA